jgi:hypothetical protein
MGRDIPECQKPHFWWYQNTGQMGDPVYENVDAQGVVTETLQKGGRRRLMAKELVGHSNMK